MMQTLTRYGTALAILIVLLFGVSLFSQPQSSEAGTAGQIGGYAWSETIGWISWNGSNYQINVASDGTMSGYGWSENIGWVSANSADLVGCPSAPCTARFQGNNMNGWLKAIGASGGWDGWISLSGPGYGVDRSGTSLTGYAWGSDVVGWLDFSYATTTYSDTCAVQDMCVNGAMVHQNLNCSQDALYTCANGCYNGSSCNAQCTLDLSQTTILRGQYASLTWTSQGATGGTISPWVGTVGTSGATSTSPQTTTTFTGSFTGPGGAQACTPATLTVTCAPTYSCSGQQIQFTNDSCVTSNYGAACASPSYCVSGQQTCQNPSVAFSGFTAGDGDGGTFPATGHLLVKPSLIRSTTAVRVYWNVANVQSCTVTEDNPNINNSWTVAGNAGNNWTSSSGTNGRVSSAISQQTTFTINCTQLDGTSLPPSFPETATVNVAPDFHED